MNVRAQAVGMCAQMQNVANAITQQFFPIFLKKCGFYSFYMFMSINFILAVFVIYCVPETKKFKLEEMDTLFGGANHVEKGATLMTESRVGSVAHQGHADEIHEARQAREIGEEKSATTQIEHMETKR